VDAVDLKALNPSPDEPVAAGRWAMTHDVSAGFASLLKNLLRSLGHGIAAERL